MRKYYISNLTLVSSEYKFPKPDPKLISISVNDYINIIEVHEKEIVLSVARELNYGVGTNSFIKVEYEVNLESSRNESTEMVMDALKTGVSELSVVFSKISLVISQLTQASPFGVLITPPNYNPQKAYIS